MPLREYAERYWERNGVQILTMPMNLAIKDLRLDESGPSTSVLQRWLTTTKGC
jgi:hypothetical protein